MSWNDKVTLVLVIFSSTIGLLSYAVIHLWRWRRRCAPRMQVPMRLVPGAFFCRPSMAPKVPGPYAPFGERPPGLIAWAGKDALKLTPQQAALFKHAMVLCEGKQTLSDRVNALTTEFMRHISGMTEPQFKERYEKLIKEWRDLGCPDYY